MLAAIAPIFALATISSLLLVVAVEVAADVEAEVIATPERVLVLTEVNVVNIPALVVVIVLNTFVTVPLVKNADSDTSNGVLAEKSRVMHRMRVVKERMDSRVDGSSTGGLIVPPGISVG
ncbi:hypothetical protein N0V93_005320 [Gnomoniopsis smithogilvyi]|uniref:Secreted peptide n=1 Tax=Gnomoniopsis smithogilvyi TaxID=1191159 RepID=A0A9W9CXX9_9PEZI|nr:hypothetical protein N0V93_005320 [Gnomoniopsis smithogilvyi]